MTESKLELEKSLKLSRKLRKELNGLTEWLAATDAELTRRSAVSGMPSDLEAEVAWAQVRPKRKEFALMHCINYTDVLSYLPHAWNETKKKIWR